MTEAFTDTLYSRAKTSSSVHQKPYLPLFSSESADKFAKDYAIKKSFRHALHLVTAHLQHQNQVAHALRTRDFWLASLSMHFPIHFGRCAHEYPVTLNNTNIEGTELAFLGISNVRIISFSKSLAVMPSIMDNRTYKYRTSDWLLVSQRRYQLHVLCSQHALNSQTKWLSSMTQRLSSMTQRLPRRLHSNLQYDGSHRKQCAVRSCPGGTYMCGRTVTRLRHFVPSYS